MGGEKDGVAGAGSDAGGHILAPGQGILAEVLEDAVDGDGQACENDCMLQAPQLGSVPQVGRGQKGDCEIAGKGVGALQAVI